MLMRPCKQSRARQAGFSLVELMIALVVDLVILAAAVAMFVNNSKSRDNIEQLGTQIENGRYASDIVADDIQNAGFFGQLNVENPTIITAPASVPDPCLTTATALASAIPLHMQGYDNASSGISCISNVKSNTDVFVVRRASTCIRGGAGCIDPSGAPYFQVSLCGTEILATNYYKISTDPATLTLKLRDCTTTAELRRYISRIYFVANDDTVGDKIPTLMRAELGAGGFTVVPVAEGIDDIQVDYGIDTNADGLPDIFEANPNASCSGSACVTKWRGVVSVRVAILARATRESKDYVNTKTYIVGRTAAGEDRVVGPFNDGYRRLVFNQQIQLNNPAGRRG